MAKNDSKGEAKDSLYILNQFRMDSDFYLRFIKGLTIVIVFTHLLHVWAYWRLGYTVLFWYNVACTIGYLIVIKLCNNKRHITKIFWYFTLEVNAYSMLAVFMLGGGSRFETYPIVLIAYAFLTQYAIIIDYLNGMEDKMRRFLFTSVGIDLIVYMINGFVITFHEPYFDMSDYGPWAKGILQANMAILIIGLLIACSMFLIYASGFASHLKKKLMEIEKLKDVAESANTAKSTFLATMTHEIRTPMNAICGSASLLADEEMSERSKEYLDTIQTSANHLSELINDVLDFTKIESGKLELLDESYRVNELFNDIFSIMTVRANEKDLALVGQISDDIPKVLRGDMGRIRQIIINLVNNAIKFTDIGRIIINIYFVKSVEDPSEGYLNIKVMDTGRGIKEEDMKKLFRVFSQVDRAKSPRTEGTGLGLAITKNLVENMDGSVEVKSEYGKGSVFSVTVKQKIVDASPCNYSEYSIGEEKTNDDRRFQTESARVLIVDDNKINLKVASGLIKRFGIETVLANSGEEAINLLKKGEQYDIVFMDYLMPEMDGIETTKIIRKLNDYCEHELVIIALSANAVEETKEEFKNAGMNDELTKPIVPRMLREILLRWLPMDKVIIE